LRATKPTLLVVITDDMYVRNYATSGAFDQLTEEYDLEFVLSSDVTLREALSALGILVGEFTMSQAQAQLHHFHFQLLMWRFRKKSKTFFYRWLRNTNWSLIRRDGPAATRIISLFRWFLGAVANPSGFQIPILANVVTFPIIARLVRAQLVTNPELVRLAQQKPYGAILFPSSAFEPATVDLVRIGKQYGIPTLCLIDNWDNLTSKTVFWEKPDHIGVWGTQAREQALRIHEFPTHGVHIIGTPRFDSYFMEPLSKSQNQNYAFPYILFVGSAMPFDEIAALKKLDEWLELSSEVTQDIKIVYRPHPWQQKRNVSAVFRGSDYSHTILDTQISEALSDGVELTSRSSAFQPNLSYYPDLLKGAACVVGPLTTMLLEATLCLRPTIGLSYFDGNHANTSKRYFSHFEGMERVPGFHFCESEPELIPTVSAALKMGRPSLATSRAATDYFVSSSPGTYSERLCALVRGITAGNLSEDPIAPKL
jgi:hypothetical protein